MMLTVDEGVYTGNPPEVLAALVDADTNAAAVCSALEDFEEEHNQRGDQGWDLPPAFALLMRNLPPKDIADQLAEVGSAAIMLGMHFLDLPPNTNYVSGPSIVQVLEALAEAVAEDQDEALKALTNVEGWDLLAWVVLVEAWEVDCVDRGEVPRIQPSLHPDRFEVRIISAVDRAGLRYQLSRRRDNNYRMLIVDTRISENGLGIHGEIPNALAKLMDAIPAVI
jgi:hypothetical protein